jgi:hypothetical protein
MKKLVCCLSVLAMVLTLGGTAMAYNFADHVKIAPNGKGDTLIYPVYAAAAANGGWETKIWVTNTALDRSVVAKVVFRSMKNTDELRDFLIYLSPTDVWNCLIRVGVSGNVEVYSTDDSSLASAGVWASATTPLQIDLADPACSDDTNVIGYVEIFMSAHSSAGGQGSVDGTLVSLNAPPVSKAAILEAYGNAGPADVDMVTDGINVLAGHAEFRNLPNGHNSVYSATALRDYDATLNNGTPLNAVNGTFFGEDGAWNSVGEVEAALNKNNISMPYSSQTGTVHFLTFPTKITGNTQNNCGVGRTSNSPFFQRYLTGQANTHLCVPFTGTDYDLQERSKHISTIFSPAPTGDYLCGEVNYVNGFGYAEGWSNYSFAPGATTFPTREAIENATADDGSYAGVPVIGTIINLGADGLYGMNAAYTDGMVQTTAAGTPASQIYYYYQYQDESNTGYLYDADLPAGESQSRTDTNLAHPVYTGAPVRVLP